MADLYSCAGGGAGAMAVARGDMDGPKGGGKELDPSSYGTKEVLLRLLGYVRPHMALFVVAFFANAVSVVLQLYVPILIGQGIDNIIGAGSVDFAGLTPVIARLAVVVAVAGITQWIAGSCTNRLSYEAVRDLREEAFGMFARLPFSFWMRTHTAICSRAWSTMRILWAMASSKGSRSSLAAS